jgi:hypothetical protein
MARKKYQAVILPDDVTRTWGFAFYGLKDIQQGNIMAAGVRRQLKCMGYLSPSEHSAIRMRFPNLTTHEE